MKYWCVTTCSESGWRETGERMVTSFLRYWPLEASLCLYAEGFAPTIGGLEVRRLPSWLDEFKARHRDEPSANGRNGQKYDYRTDCVKFSHKVAALTDFAVGIDDGVVVWLDADVVSHAPVTPQWLDGLFPEPSYLAWLDRYNCHPECGLVLYRASHRSHRLFMERFAGLYQSDKVLSLPETHDSYVLQQLVTRALLAHEIERPVSLSGDSKGWHHPFIAGPLGQCLDHCKGRRKELGKSPRRDLQRPRIEPYWAC